MSLKRDQQPNLVIIKKDATTSGTLSLEQHAFGSIRIPATSGSLTIHVSNDETNYTALKDKDGNPIGIFASGDGNVVLPNELFHFRRFRLVSDATETAERTFHTILKS